MHDICVTRIAVQGFKSLKHCDIALGNMNVLIGPNGAGKSSFLELFSFLQHIVTGRLQTYTSKHGGPDALLSFGQKKTNELCVDVSFTNQRSYHLSLQPTLDNHFMFTKSAVQDALATSPLDIPGDSEFTTSPKLDLKFSDIVEEMKSWHPVHCNDTGDAAPIKQRQPINDNLYLRSNGSNLAPILYRLLKHHSESYTRIVRTLRLAVPFFTDFHLRPCTGNPEQIELEWTEKGEEIPLKAHQLSDSTLRFMSLTTLLLLPEELQPPTIIIDEPELGLSPAALQVLCALLHSISHSRQIILATQSLALVETCAPEDLIVAERSDLGTLLYHPKSSDLKGWLLGGSLEDLWPTNLLEGHH